MIERGERYRDKMVRSEGFVTVRGRAYYKRVFTDGCAELARTDGKTGMQVFLYFPSTQPPLQLAAIKEAVKHNFDAGLLIG